MKKFLGVILPVVMILALAMAAQAATVKLPGTWDIKDTYIDPDGHITNSTEVMVISTLVGTLFAGTISGDFGECKITGQVDSGSNFHFGISTYSSGEYNLVALGRGTVSSKYIKGTYSNTIGETGSFTGTKRK